MFVQEPSETEKISDETNIVLNISEPVSHNKSGTDEFELNKSAEVEVPETPADIENALETLAEVAEVNNIFSGILINASYYKFLSFLFIYLFFYSSNLTADKIVNNETGTGKFAKQSVRIRLLLAEKGRRQVARA